MHQDVNVIEGDSLKVGCGYCCCYCNTFSVLIAMFELMTSRNNSQVESSPNIISERYWLRLHPLVRHKHHCKIDKGLLSPTNYSE